MLWEELITEENYMAEKTLAHGARLTRGAAGGFFREGRDGWMEKLLHNTPFPLSGESFLPQSLGLRGNRATRRFEPLIFCLDSLSLPADIYI